MKKRADQHTHTHTHKPTTPQLRFIPRWKRQSLELWKRLLFSGIFFSSSSFLLLLKLWNFTLLVYPLFYCWLYVEFSTGCCPKLFPLSGPSLVWWQTTSHLGCDSKFTCHFMCLISCVKKKKKNLFGKSYSMIIFIYFCPKTAWCLLSLPVCQDISITTKRERLRSRAPSSTNDRNSNGVETFYQSRSGRWKQGLQDVWRSGWKTHLDPSISSLWGNSLASVGGMERGRERALELISLCVTQK